MLDRADSAGLGIDQEVLGACGCQSKLMTWWGAKVGAHKVLAMPPVARIPQRTVLGDDIAAIEL